MTSLYFLSLLPLFFFISLFLSQPAENEWDKQTQDWLSFQAQKYEKNVIYFLTESLRIYASILEFQKRQRIRQKDRRLQISTGHCSKSTGYK